MVFAEETPTIVEFVNHYIGEPVYNFQIHYTQPFWDKYILSYFGTNAETLFGAYTPETAVPWYTTMFVLACIVSLTLIWILRGRLSDQVPEHGQQVLELGVSFVRGLLTDIVGPHGMKYFPVIATFGLLILVSNLFSFIPGLLPPTAATNVTFALGISSFIYYNYIGIRENGLVGHLKHFLGPFLPMAVLIFPIEIVSNLVRPMSLGIRLFGNMFADEQVVASISNLYAPYTMFFIPALLMVLGLFVALIQTFIFMFLSLIYLGEVSHAPHDGDGHRTEGQATEYAEPRNEDDNGVGMIMTA